MFLPFEDKELGDPSPHSNKNVPVIQMQVFHMEQTGLKKADPESVGINARLACSTTQMSKPGFPNLKSESTILTSWLASYKAPSSEAYDILVTPVKEKLNYGGLNKLRVWLFLLHLEFLCLIA